MPHISACLGVSYNNLIKLVQKLTQAGILSTHQGKYGGVSLNRSAEEISLKDVIACIEGETQLSECIQHTTVCSLVGCCEIRSVLSDVQTSIDQMLHGINIASIVNNQQKRSPTWPMTVVN